MKTDKYYTISALVLLACIGTTLVAAATTDLQKCHFFDMHLDTDRLLSEAMQELKERRLNAELEASNKRVQQEWINELKDSYCPKEGTYTPPEAGR